MLEFVEKDKSWLIQIMSGFLWLFGQRQYWMERVWVAGLPFTGQRIYVPRRRYRGMGSVNWMEENARVIGHEIVHIEQRGRMGDVWFALAYLLWPPSRFRFEVEANLPMLRALSPWESNPVAVVRETERMQEFIIDQLRGYYLCWVPSRRSMQEYIRQQLTLYVRRQNNPAMMQGGDTRE